jgi:hypothetical protein
VNVLAEHRRLQNQIAKALQRDVIALVVAHLLALPLLERMRPAAADLDVLLRRRAQDALLHHRELRRRLVDGLTHAGGDFEHAFGDVVFDFTAFDVVFDGGDERGGVLAEIVPGGLTTCSSSSMPRVNGSEDLKSGKGMAHSVVCEC